MPKFRKGYIYRNPLMKNSLGEPSFCLFYWDLNGQRKRVRTNATTEEDAQRMLRDIESQIDKAKVFGLSSVDQLDSMSFGKYIEEKLFPVWGIELVGEDFKVTKSVDEIDRSTARRYLNNYHNLKDTFGKVNLRAITLGMVKEWRAKRQRAPCPKTARLPENATVNRDVDFIRMVLRSAVPDYLPYNPVVYSNLKKFTRLTELPRKRKATEEEWGLLLQHAGDRAGGLMKPFLIVAYETLLRPSDVLRLQLDDLLWHRELIRVSAESKTARHTGESYASFNFKAQDALKLFLKERGIKSRWIFVNPDTGQPYTVDYMSHAFAKLADAIGSPDLQLRDLRRTGGTYLGANVPGSMVSKALGHTTGAMLKHYVALEEAALREVGRVLAARPEPSAKSMPNGG